MKVAGIVVTYNRRSLLERCIEALSSQTMQLQSIIIIDNASTDDTALWFSQSVYANNPNFIYIKLSSNTGGAGGFNAALKYSLEQKYNWAWIMDDDALPEKNAFEMLMAISPTPENIYGSIAICGENTSWPTTIINKDSIKLTNNIQDIPDLAEVSFLPFLGLLVHSSTIEKIGLPDGDFFIAGDDLEYCLRAKKTGMKIIVAGQSRVNHPKAEIYTFNIFGCKIDTLKIPPWKSYYNTRNKILIARKYYSFRLLTETLPGIIVRILINILLEQHKLVHLHAVVAGVIDGVLGLKGKRHILWKIKA